MSIEPAAGECCQEAKEAAACLAAFIREHVDALAVELVQSYWQNYPFSAKNWATTDEQRVATARLWAGSFADALESGGGISTLFLAHASDNVIQSDELFTRTATAIESILWAARTLAVHVISTNQQGSAHLADMLQSLGNLVRRSVGDCADHLVNEVLDSGSLVESWENSLIRQKQKEASAGLFDETEHVTPKAEMWTRLTPREREIASRAATGVSNKELARELGLGLSTVKNALSRVYEKLGVAGRTELAILASRIKS